jgi:signal transduction histidine kinase
MQWDLFISHASEDKDSFVRPLAIELQQRNLRVWYDEFSLKLGDSLNRSINSGLAESQFGIVVLSNHFFAKEWPRRELDGLVAREISEGKVILPLWHGVTEADVRKHSPILADRVAVNTSKGISDCVIKILEIVQPIPVHTLHLTRRTIHAMQHGILSPIDAILIQIEWMEQYFLRAPSPVEWDIDKIRIKFNDIKKSAKHIEMILNTMIGTEDNEPFRPQECHLIDMIKRSATLLTEEAQRRNVQVGVEDIGLPIVRGDRLHFLRIFYHLLKNAIIYSDPNEPHKYVFVSGVDDPEDIVLSFADNGIGISKGEEEVIFQMFSRGATAGRVFPEGMGMGLYYCRNVVRKYGGSIGVDRSHLAKPTIIQMRLPKAKR